MKRNKIEEKRKEKKLGKETGKRKKKEKEKAKRKIEKKREGKKESKLITKRKIITLHKENFKFFFRKTSKLFSKLFFYLLELTSFHLN